MSSKRKAAEVEVEPKKRQSGVVRKRTRDDSSDVDVPVKTSRKKSAVEESVPVAVPTPKKSTKNEAPVVTSPSKTPRQSRNSMSSQFWMESLEMQAVSPPAKASAKIQTNKAEAATPKARATKAAPTSRVVTPVKPETPKTPMVEKVTTSGSSYLPSPTPSVNGSRWSAGYEVIVEDEDDDRVGFWKHACCTLKTAASVITPIFLVMIVVSYIVAAVITDHTLAIASMGITFCIVLVLILSSYAVAVLPAIYVSRLFTALVLTPSDSNATQWPWQWKRNLNFYSTFTALCVLAVLSLTIVLNV